MTQTHLSTLLIMNSFDSITLQKKLCHCLSAYFKLCNDLTSL